MLFRTAWLSVAVTMVMGLAAASHADDWGTVVAISSTMGVHGDRVCVGEATRGDIGCPTYAPYVSATSGFMGIGTNSPTTALDVNGRIRTNNEIISNPTASAEGGHLILAYPTSSTISGQGNGTWNVDVFSDKSLRLFRRDVSGVALTPFQIFENGNVGIGKGASTQLDVSGTVSATRFVGDGSQLTGVVASTADRIVSGTTSLLAVSSTGFVSLTQAGTNTGWFDPTRGLVTLGASATGAISGSTGYFNKLAIGPGATPIYPLNLRASAQGAGVESLTVTNISNMAGGNFNQFQTLFRRHTAGTGWGGTNIRLQRYVDTSAMGFIDFGIDDQNGNWGLGFGSGSTTQVVIRQNGNVGIGTSTPRTEFEVSGSIFALSKGTSATLSLASGDGEEGTPGIFIHDPTAGNINFGGWVYYDDRYGRNQMRISALNSGTEISFIAIDRNTPFVGVGTNTPTTHLEVSGTVSATRFVGDGSGLTGVVASTADRIVSGTTSLLAVSSTGFVSLTQAGVNTGWFDPTRGLVTLGVSATGRISATSGYFTSGIVISSPVAYRAMVYKTNGLNRWQLSTNNSAETGSNAGSDFFIQYADDAGIWSGIPLFVRRGNGNIGMNTTDPSQTLHVAGSALTTSWTGINFSAANVTPTAPLEVSGTVSATYVQLADNDDVPCTPERKGTLRFSNGIVSICRAQ